MCDFNILYELLVKVFYCLERNLFFIVDDNYCFIFIVSFVCIFYEKGEIILGDIIY